MKTINVCFRTDYLNVKNVEVNFHDHKLHTIV